MWEDKTQVFDSIFNFYLSSHEYSVLEKVIIITVVLQISVWRIQYNKKVKKETKWFTIHCYQGYLRNKEEQEENNI